MKKLVTLGLAALMAGAMVMGASAEEKVDLNVIAAQYGQNTTDCGQILLKSSMQTILESI